MLTTMRQSQTSTTLRQIGVVPIKSLGQNFLHARNLSRWIVDQLDVTPADYIVEIGPGLGALTAFVLAKGAQVLAIEKDARLVEFLNGKFACEQLQIKHGDALKFEVQTLLAKPKVKLLGNLPYYISSQLLL